MSINTLEKTHCGDLFLLNRGKVRDIYGIPGHDNKLLLVATDRISAYDVVMDDPIQGKGRILTQLTLFWLDLLRDIVSNHLITANVDEYPEICHQYRDQLEGRSMIVKKVGVLPIECIVRGCMSGSMLKAYQRANLNSDTGCKMVLGHIFPKGLVESDFLQHPIFTPSTKAEQGLHDENIDFQKMIDILEKWLKNGINNYQGTAEQLADDAQRISLKLYRKATAYASNRGIIIADTKFEFGISDEGKFILIDEILTPDSSRFWPAEEYEPGKSQPSFDKQFLRDYLSSLDWNKTPPPPRLPDEVVEKTGARYEEALKRLTGS